MKVQMAFTLRNLSVLAYAQGFTLWHYKHLGKCLADVGKAQFFDLASAMLASGDMILISAKDGGRCAVVSVAGNAVHLCPMA
eukprot:gene1988-2024_t